MSDQQYSFFESVVKSFDKASKFTKWEKGLLEQIKACNAVYQMRFPVKMDDGTTTSGKIYRAWMDVKALFTGNDHQTILNNCEYGEDAAQKAYNEALKTDNLPAYLYALINRQKDELKKAHDEIKSLRDQEKLVHEHA